jgi:CO/xanthine dehydrogenase Mo-binding subunit
MTKHERFSASRRTLLKGLGGTAGMLVISVGMPVTLDTVLSISSAAAQTGGRPALVPDQLSSYIAVNADGSVSAFFGKMDMGQGLFTAIGQMVAEELDVPFERVTVLMGDTATSVNQGGASGSTGVWRGGFQMRHAAAEARRVLVEMAATHFGVPAERMTVENGVVKVVPDARASSAVNAAGDNAKFISYGDLVGGRYFNVKLEWNGKMGNELFAPGKAKPKPPSEYKIVGQSIPRSDIAPKVYCQEDFCTDVKVPGMLHGRMIRPPVAGAVPLRVDEASVKDIPGVRIVREKNFLGLVAETEWDAIQAVDKLKVEWSDVAPPFPAHGEIYNHIRKAPVRKREVPVNVGDVDGVLSGATRVIEAEYEWPFQSHACMGPAAAVVEIKDGKLTCWSGSQKPHYVRDGLTKILGMKPEDTRVIWVVGPGSYGRSDAGDAAIDAAILARAVGRPVRVQGMRHEGHGWDPKGPASIHRARAALDANDNMIAYDFLSKGFSRLDIVQTEANPSHSLAGQLMDWPIVSVDAFNTPSEAYHVPNKRAAWETIAPLLDRASPLRSSHLRDPVGPQIHFASESFIDEAAAAAGADPIAFRLRHLKDARDIALIKAVAEKSGWQTRPSPRSDQSGAKVSGRGMAYAQRNGTRVAIVAEVEVDRNSGKIWGRKFTVAHDCGQIINPDGVVKAIEGNIIQGMSRTVWEEVQFDSKNVTSTDWMSYPILDITETPEAIDCVLINHPEIAPTGAGEGSIRPLAAAMANAIFDATGVRLRRIPFTPDRVKAAFA